MGSDIGLAVWYLVGAMCLLLSLMNIIKGMPMYVIKGMGIGIGIAACVMMAEKQLNGKN